MRAEHKKELVSIKERAGELWARIGEIRELAEELKEEADNLVEEHQSWMDDRSLWNNNWENTPTGQRASEEHDVLEDLAYHVEEWKDSLENIEQDIDNDLAGIYFPS